MSRVFNTMSWIGVVWLTRLLVSSARDDLRAEGRLTSLVSLLGDLEQLVRIQHPVAYTVGHKAEQRGVKCPRLQPRKGRECMGRCTNKSYPMVKS